MKTDRERKRESSPMDILVNFGFKPEISQLKKQQHGQISGTPRLDARHRRRRHLPCLFVWHAHEADIKSVKKVATTLHRHVFTALLRRCPLQQQQLQSTEHTEFRCFLCFQEISKVTTFNMYVYTYTYINKLSY